MIGIIVHGGAGDIKLNEEVPARIEVCKKASLAGFSLLKKGSSATNAVVAAVKVLEDHPLFNAGRGSYLNEEGDIEMDAAVMNGNTLDIGAVAGIHRVKNPVELARLIMEKSPHNFLIGEGAEAFAKEIGIQFMPFYYFLTERTIKFHKSKFGDTVGAVALDQSGKIAVAVSTGGTPHKHKGRVGDSPLVGSGFYANGSYGAVATGIGEDIMKITLSARVGFYLDFGKKDLNSAVSQSVKDLDVVNGKAGLIAMDKNGNISFAHNTKGMFYAYIKEGMKQSKGGI